MVPLKVERYHRLAALEAIDAGLAAHRGLRDPEGGAQLVSGTVQLTGRVEQEVDLPQGVDAGGGPGDTGDGDPDAGGADGEGVDDDGVAPPACGPSSQPIVTQPAADLA